MNEPTRPAPKVDQWKKCRTCGLMRNQQYFQIITKPNGALERDDECTTCKRDFYD